MCPGPAAQSASGDSIYLQPNAFTSLEDAFPALMKLIPAASRAASMASTELSATVFPASNRPTVATPKRLVFYNTLAVGHSVGALLHSTC